MWSECDLYIKLGGWQHIYESDTSPPNTLINTITYRHCTHCTHNTLDSEHRKGTLVLHNLQGVVYIYYLHIHSVLDKLKYCTVQNIITKISLVLLNGKCYKIIPKNMEKIKIMVAANYCSTILNFYQDIESITTLRSYTKMVLHTCTQETSHEQTHVSH